MDDGRIAKTYFLAGRATRISRNGAVAMAKGVVSSARLLNPFNWRKEVHRLQSRKGGPVPTARLPGVGGHAASGEVTAAEAAAAKFAGTAEALIFSRARKDMASRDGAARARATRALGAIRHPLSVKTLSAHLARDPSTEVRRECVNALMALGMKEGLPAVERALSDRSPIVRLAAVRGTYRLGGTEGAASLVRMLSDEHEDVRRRAVACIGWLGQERLAVKLLPLLSDKSIFVRRTALDALGNLKSLRAASRIIDLLVDPDESVRKKAFAVLEAITGRQMAEAFPEDEHGHQLLLARWRAWKEEQFWHRDR
jgi:hypothetical protein